jgi:hypothetical protein
VGFSAEIGDDMARLPILVAMIVVVVSPKARPVGDHGAQFRRERRVQCLFERFVHTR